MRKSWYEIRRRGWLGGPARRPGSWRGLPSRVARHGQARRGVQRLRAKRLRFTACQVGEAWPSKDWKVGVAVGEDHVPAKAAYCGNGESAWYRSFQLGSVISTLPHSLPRGKQRRPYHANVAAAPPPHNPGFQTVIFPGSPRVCALSIRTSANLETESMGATAVRSAWPLPPSVARRRAATGLPAEACPGRWYSTPPARFGPVSAPRNITREGGHSLVILQGKEGILL